MQPTGPLSKNQEKVLAGAALAAILALAAVFRLVQLRSYPGWHSDEGYFLDFAAHLAGGEWRNFCTLGAPYLERPPLYLYLLSAGMRLFGADILISRGLSAISGIAAASLLYLLAAPACGKRTALLGSALFAVLPWAVAYNRLGLTYNLMAPLFLLALLAAWQYGRRPSLKWLLAGGVSAGLALSTDYLGAAALLPLAVAWIGRGKRRLAGGLAVFLLTVASVLALPLLMEPQLFWQDLALTWASRSAAGTNGSVLLDLALNFTELLRRESWILLGICGLFLLPDRRLRGMSLALAGVTILGVARSFPPVGRSLHYLIHLFPLFALGIAAFAGRAIPWARAVLSGLADALEDLLPALRAKRPIRAVARWLVVWPALIFLFGGPVLWMLMADTAITVYGNEFLFSGNDNLDLTPAADAEKVMAFLEEHGRPADLVLASPQLAWAVPSERKADFRNQQAYDNLLAGTSMHLPRARFRYPCGLEDATFVILDPLARDFAPRALLGMERTLQTVESWPLVYRAGSLALYRNPHENP